MSIWSMDRDDRRLARLGKSGKITGEENEESDDDHYFPIAAYMLTACMSNRSKSNFYQLLLSSRGELFFPLRKLKFIAHLSESLAVVEKKSFSRKR